MHSYIHVKHNIVYHLEYIKISSEQSTSIVSHRLSAHDSILERFMDMTLFNYTRFSTTNITNSHHGDRD